MKDLTLCAASAKSVIHCGAGAFNTFAPDLTKRQIYVVTDSNVFAIYRHLMWQTFGDNFPVTILPAARAVKPTTILSPF